MDQRERHSSGAEGAPEASAPSAALTADGPMRYLPVIGTGPLPAAGTASSGPLVPDPAPGVPGSETASAVALLAAEAAATTSGHAVPEFLAGAAAMTQMLAGQFPMSVLPEQAIGETVGLAQAMVQAAQSLLVMATSEALTRGLPAATGHSVPDWVGTWAPQIDRSEALATARLATAQSEPSLEALSHKVTDGTARVGLANQVVRFVQEMTPIADEQSLTAMVTLLTDNIESLTSAQMTLAIREAKLALKKPDDDDSDEEKLTNRRLLRRVGTVAGLAEWQLLLDEEAEGILQAALDPLTKPRPSADEFGHQQHDPRTASQRRADALVEILGRSAATDDSDLPTSGAAKIQVTTNLEALKGLVPGGGIDEHGHHLSPGAIRRLACDADLYPVVLGGPSEPLDVGRLKRLFTPGQRKAVYLRDRHCSFPGCTVPPAWCQIHHVLHWVFGGRTDLLNAAALCQRHHTIVHKYGFTATVTDTGVTWHLPSAFSSSGSLTSAGFS